MPFEVKPEFRLLALGALSFATIHATPALARKAPPPPPVVETGPAADYPMVIGDPFAVEGKTYTPADTLNYDAVGQAHVEPDTDGVTMAHRTLPLPSYVEVTALASGRTALVRVTRRGPMAGGDLVALSPAAWAQLGLDGAQAPVRVRRVNPPEAERALLRTGQRAPERMETPQGLLTVLRRKLGDGEGAMLSAAPKPAVPPVAPAPLAQAAPAAPAPKPKVAAAPTPKKADKPQLAAAKAAPMRVVGEHGAKAAKPREPEAKVAAAANPTAAEPAPAPVPARKSGFVVQLGAFGEKGRAETIASKAGARVTAAGKVYRVRLGPFADASAAQAALAKVRAGGYAEARVLREP